MFRRTLCSVACVLSVFLSAVPVAKAQEEATTVDPVPRLLRNLKSDSVKAASSAARSLGVVFAPGRKPHPAREEVIDALIEKLESKLGGAVRRDSAWALGRIEAKKALA